MPLKSHFSAFSAALAGAGLAAALFGSGRPLFASEQAPAQPAPQTPVSQPVIAPPPTGALMRLTADEAVRLALENNLGIQAERLAPQINTLAIAQARAAYAPSLFTTFNTRSSTQPPSSYISGTSATLTNETFSQSGGIQQFIPWGGGQYSLSLDGGKATTSSIDSRFNPQLSSNLAASVTQPLLRNFGFDNIRQQIATTQNNQVIADLGLREQVAITTQAVRNTYFELIGAIEGQKVARQSLDLALASLKNNQTRVEVGTLAQIDIIEAEAEVAANEENLINADARIKTIEDRLRSLVLNSAQPDFWTIRIEPADAPALTPIAIDVEAAIANALANRTDIARAKKQLENVDLDIRLARNQKLPNLDVTANYNVIGVGGTERVFGDGFPPPVLSQSQRSFTEALQRRLRPGLPHLERAPELQLPDRHEHRRGQPRRGAPAAAAGQRQPARARAGGGDLGAGRRAPGRHQPAPGRGHPQGARPRRAAARGAGEAHDGRPLDHLRAGAGAARPGAAAAAGGQRDDRLQPIDHRLRDDPDGSGRPLAFDHLGAWDRRVPRAAHHPLRARSRPSVTLQTVTKLTVTVITHNERSHIAAALASVSWADEIIVIDSHSTDGTAELARPLATVVEVRDWAGYGAQKNYAADRATHDWILSIDADERATPELADEVRDVMRRGPVAPGTRSRASRITSVAGCAAPTGTPISTCGSTTAASRDGASAACTNRSK